MEQNLNDSETKATLLQGIGNKSQPVVLTSLVGLLTYFIMNNMGTGKNNIQAKVLILEERMRVQEQLLEKISNRTDEIYKHLIDKRLK